MNGQEKGHSLNRLTGLLRRRRTGSALPMPSTGSALETALAPPGDEGLSPGLLEWAHTPARIPWLEGAYYQYRLGGHHLVLASCGVARCDECEVVVGRAEVECALVVEGPLLVLGSRLGDTRPWSWASPYNWHFAPPAERVVPAAVPLTPETYARLWATLWITLWDTATGRARMGRAVALRPEFTRALHGVLREQAMRPFHVASAERALDGLRFASAPLELRARVMTRSTAASRDGGRWALPRTRRGDSAQGTSTRKHHEPRSRVLDRHHRRVLDAHPPYLHLPPPLSGGPGGRPDARRSDETPGE
jgi:hypothetical protein